MTEDPAPSTGAPPHRRALGWTTEARLRRLVILAWTMLFVVGLTAVLSLVVQVEHIRRLTLEDGPAVSSNNQARQAMTKAQGALAAYQASGDRTSLLPYLSARDTAMAALSTLQGKLGLGAVDEADAAQQIALGNRQRLVAEQWWANALVIQRDVSRGEPADITHSRDLFDRFAAASAATGGYLARQHDQTWLDARATSWRGVAISITSLLALMVMLVLGRRAAGTISRPLTDLRDTMVRQRRGERGARAREDQGTAEARSVAVDFNALTEQNHDLLRAQARDLSTLQITLQIARAMRAASDLQEALGVMCVEMGQALGGDRVVAKTIGVRQEAQLGAQWHGPSFAPLADLSVLPGLGGLDEEQWLMAGFRAQDDLPEVTESPPEPGDTSYQATGARAVIMVPIGLDERVIGMIYVFMVRAPRAWTMAEASVVQAAAGFVARAIGAAEHHANQREYVARIESLDRQKSDFLATVSHELRTPLTSISGYLEVLRERETGSLTVQQDQMLEVISRNTDRLRSLIEGVLVLSRIEGVVSQGDFVGVSTDGLITRAGEELSMLAQGSAIELEIEAGPPAFVLGDQASLDRAVVNILSNAIKFSLPGGVVTLKCTLDQGASKVLITCQDRGVGIPAHDQPGLFTRFFRASNAGDRAIPGTGLGLSIAKEIVESHHGGELRLTSVEDEGTTVVLDLPLHVPLGCAVD